MVWRWIVLLIVALGPAVPAWSKTAAVLKYELTLAAHPAEHRLAVRGTVEAPGSLTGSSTIKFRLPRSSSGVVWKVAIHGQRLDAKRTGGTAVRPDGPAEWLITGNWPQGAPLKLQFAYEIVTPTPEGFLYLGPEVSFGLGDWYPNIPDTRAIGLLTIDAPAGSVIVSAGQRLADQVSGDGHSIAKFDWAFPAELVFGITPSTAFSERVSPELQLITLERSARVASWRHGLPATKAALETAFGALPFHHVSVIEVPSAIAEKSGFGAVASPGLILASSELIKQPFNVAGFAHEFAHLWWGHVVGLEGQKGDFLLDEGVAQYGSMIAMDVVLGPAAGRDYRMIGTPGFNENLFSATGFLKIKAAGLDRPLLALEDDGLSYWIAYSKAGLAWYALAQFMGPDRFQPALRDVLAAHRAGSVTWDEFVAALQRRSQSPLAPFIEAWFQRGSAPCYALTWAQSGHEVVGQIDPCGDPKPASLEVETRDAGGWLHRQNVRVPTTGPVAFRWPSGVGKVRSVTLDPDYKVLRWTPELTKEAAALSQQMRGSALARIGRKSDGEATLYAWLERNGRDNAYDRLILTHATLARLTRERGCDACAAAHIAAALLVPAQRLQRLAPTYLSLHLAAYRLNRFSLAERALTLALAGDAMVNNANGVAQKAMRPSGGAAKD